MNGSVPAVPHGLPAKGLPPPSPVDPPELANRRAGWKKYPMIMRHPAEQAAVVSNDRTVDPSTGREVWVNAPPGKSIRFGPVTVLNEHQEELHQSKGYRGAGDPAAIERHERAPIPAGYRYEEYPRILEDGTIDEGPDAPQAPDNFYPFWVRAEGWPDELVQDREEHQALLTKYGLEEPPPPVTEVEARDVKIASLEDQIAELKALILLQMKGAAGQPAQVPPAADAAEPVIPAASSEPPDQVKPEPVDSKVNTIEPAVEPRVPVPENTAEPAAQVSDEPGATDPANLQADPQPGGEPSAEETIKARMAELDAEEAALEVEESAEAPAKQGKRK
jgi:hypothetical protein